MALRGLLTSFFSLRSLAFLGSCVHYSIKHQMRSKRTTRSSYHVERNAGIQRLVHLTACGCYAISVQIKSIINRVTSVPRTSLSYWIEAAYGKYFTSAWKGRCSIACSRSCDGVNWFIELKGRSAILDRDLSLFYEFTNSASSTKHY